MNEVYVISNYIFRKEYDAGDGGAYYTIIHPDGRYLDYRHYFPDYYQMEAWVRNRNY